MRATFVLCAKPLEFVLGHLSHGFQTPTKKISATSIFFETMPYRLDETTGVIDYDALDKSAELYRPKLIVAGASAYSRLIDYDRIRAICDKARGRWRERVGHKLTFLCPHPLFLFLSLSFSGSTTRTCWPTWRTLAAS
jgi:hypothetical protein